MTEDAMNARVRLWYLAAIAACVAGGVWLLLPPLGPPPPDFTDGGFTSVRVEFRSVGGATPLSAETSDPAVVAGLAEVLRTGKSVVVCRCGAVGRLEFRRPDGTSEEVMLMPAHEEEAVEFRVMGRGRYRVDRERFLKVVSPLGLPAARWYQWPET